METDFDKDSWDRDGRIVVRVDKDIEDLIPDYLEMTHADVAKLRAALGNGDFETLNRIGHMLKGSGGGYGFDGITEVGKNIEQLAKTRAQDDLDLWIGRLASYLERIEVIPE
jgi:HPt (histidine-containing phosphotransfer) domain-containing protein